MRKYLFFFAIIGWISGLIVHILSLAQFDVTAKVPFVWVLHIGIFVVWLPAILLLRKNKEIQAYQQSAMLCQKKPLALFKIIFEHTPLWLKVIAVGGFFYAGLNFILTMFTQHGSPDFRDGQYILHSRGVLIKAITEQQYHRYKANEIRGFSGHWLAFYGIAAAVLFPLPTQSRATAGAASQKGIRF